MSDQFEKDVDEGLSHRPKTLSSKYFYDKKGSEIFQQIMNMPEYYLTNAELEIFTIQTKDLIHSFDVDKNQEFEIVELGAGDGTKTILLLEYLIEHNYQFVYKPIDISASALEYLVQFLKDQLPSLKIEVQHGDYFTKLEKLKQNDTMKIVMFIGSNLGNLQDILAKDFLNKLSENLLLGDKLLLGLDLIKSKNIVLPAYNDESGITKAFNLNLLHRINRELGGNFIVENFIHQPEYSESIGIAKSYLTSKKDQVVYIKKIGKYYHFKKGEKIRTEISRKYNDALLNKLISESTLKIKEKFTDINEYFADYLLEKT